MQLVGDKASSFTLFLRRSCYICCWLSKVSTDGYINVEFGKIPRTELSIAQLNISAFCFRQYIKSRLTYSLHEILAPSNTDSVSVIKWGQWSEMRH